MCISRYIRSLLHGIFIFIRYCKGVCVCVCHCVCTMYSKVCFYICYVLHSDMIQSVLIDEFSVLWVDQLTSFS